MDSPRPESVATPELAELRKRYEELQLRVTQFSVVEQKLVAARQRLDRQVAIHTRMQRFNAMALRESDDAAFARLVVEGLADAFEVEIGLLLTNLHGEGDPDIAVQGLPPGDGLDFLQNLQARGPAPRALQFLKADELARILPGRACREALVWYPSVPPSGPSVLLVAANSIAGAASYEPLEPELAEVFTVFAQQVEAHFASRRARDALRLGEERTRAIIASALDAVVLLDDRATVSDWNPEAERILGWSKAEAMGRAISDLILPPDGQDAAQSGVDRFFTGAGLVLNERLPLTAVRQGGERFEAEITVTSFQQGKAQLYSLFLRDLTGVRKEEEHRRRLEHELEQARKLETLGTLAGGVAHDFNNILTGMFGFVELAVGSLPPEHEAVRLLEQSRQGMFRARDLVKRLLLFARRVPPRDQVEVDLCRLIGETLVLVRAAVPSSITLERPPPTPDCLVRGDEGQLQQVIMNLCINASQAIGDRPGRIRIELGRRRPPEGMGPRELLRLAVIDDGCGMDAATVARIFDPFFTTKGSGGTGLGLSIVMGVVQQHGGRVEVTSEPGRGTCMEVFLPRLDEAAPAAVSPPPAADRLPEGGGRPVLLADDEDPIRMVLATFLEDAGFRVIECADGAEASEAFAGEGANLVLAVLDLTMPGRTGIDLALEFRAARPGLPILLTSGDHERHAGEGGESLDRVVRLQKPFSLEELQKAVGLALALGQ